MLRTALKFLWYDKAKSMGALMGIVISTFLIGQQAGVFVFLTNAMNVLARLNDQYIWVIDNKTENVTSLGKLDMRIQRQIASFPDVDRVYPYLTLNATVQFPDGDNSTVLLVGIQAPDFVGGPPPKYLLEGNLSSLLNDGAMCVEYFDSRAFPVSNIGTPFEINGRRAYVAVRTKGVRGFSSNGIVYTTIERARTLTKTPYYQASAFLVKINPGANADLVCRQINQHIYGVRAWKGKDLASATVSTILKTTSIGFSIGSLVVFAFIAGFFIVGLTLYSSAIDRLKDYGTMKAIGATNGYIRKLIYTQALIFALSGFTLGYLLLIGFKNGIAKTGLLFDYSPAFIGILVGIIVFISFGGASFAARRIARLEPAEVFRF